MEKVLYQGCLDILNEELMEALGCTEPIAVAYASAKAREVLGVMPEKCTVRCSGNIVKNVKAVIVPNSGGLKGIDVAATLGIVGGNPNRALQVLESVTPDDIKRTNQMLANSFCTCELEKDVDNLYVAVTLTAGIHTSLVEIQEYHTNITRIEKDGKVLLDKKKAAEKKRGTGTDRSILNIRSILQFADELELEDVELVLDRQIRDNSEISAEGLAKPYGVQVGRTLMARAEQSQGLAKTILQARATAAAGSDARMGGCSLPVVINSGSGNQGITITMPVVVFAKYWKISWDVMLRALALADLISIHQKKYIGSLSAYCGASSAATGAACGVAYMLLNQKKQTDRIYPVICDTITNSIGTISGMVCDGAKSSCAMKISVAIENAMEALELALENNVYQKGEGITMSNIEDTICAVGRMARVGMKSTDVEILNIMLGH